MFNHDILIIDSDFESKCKANSFFSFVKMTGLFKEVFFGDDISDTLITANTVIILLYDGKTYNPDNVSFTYHLSIDIRTHSTISKIFELLINTMQLPGFSNLPLLKKGQSKEIRKITDNLVAIKYLDTISSHTNNIFGDMESTGEIRMKFNAWIQELLQQNEIETAYCGLWKDSDECVYGLELLVYSPPIEVIAKSRFIGTPVDIYYNLSKYKTKSSKFINIGDNYPNTKWVIRFDWRNPARTAFTLKRSEWDTIVPYFSNLLTLLESNQDEVTVIVSEDRDAEYKQKVNELISIYENRGMPGLNYQILKKLDCKHYKPDQTIPEMIADNFIDTVNAKKNVLKVLSILQNEFSLKGYDLWDICFTLTEDGEKFFGEISPDCMRLKQHVSNLTIDGIDICEMYFPGYIDFDKDIWRKNGRSDRNVLNKILTKRWNHLYKDVMGSKTNDME